MYQGCELFVVVMHCRCIPCFNLEKQSARHSYINTSCDSYLTISLRSNPQWGTTATTARLFFSLNSTSLREHN